MELDKTILEKICYDKNNSGSENPVPIILKHYEVIIDDIDWTVKCFYSKSFNRVGWSYEEIEYISKVEYKREKNRIDRERKLTELGI